MRYGLIILLSMALLLSAANLNSYAAEAAKESSLDSYKLLATILESTPEGSFAVIKDINSDQLGIYKIGNTISGYQIAKILRGQVVLLRNGKKFVLNFPIGSVNQPFTEISNNTRIMNKAALSNKVPDINTALQQAIPIPYIQGGKIVGLKITNVKNKSLAAQAGIKEGDIIVSINNQKLDNIKTALDILHQMKTQEKINVMVKSGKDIKNLIYYVN